MLLTNKDISDALDTPKTKVEHWFRTDKSFAIPSSEIWLELKELLEIETNQFDDSIMEFETKEGVFESAKRIYDSKASYPTITASNLMPKVIHKNVKTELRAITNIEAERLQGFPDNYTQIPYRGRPKEECPSSRRYEAVGRSMSINVMEWLGTRIEKVHKNMKKFDFSNVDDFDNHIKLSIPNFETLDNIFSAITKEYAQPESYVLDLGCSTGRFLHNLDKIEDAEYRI